VAAQRLLGAAEERAKKVCRDPGTEMTSASYIEFNHHKSIGGINHSQMAGL